MSGSGVVSRVSMTSAKQVAFTYGSVGWGRHTLQDIETVVDEVCYAKTIDNGSLVARFSTEMNVPR